MTTTLRKLIRQSQTTVRTRWRVPEFDTTDNRKAVLVHQEIGAVVLPWWPEDVEQSDLARTYDEWARPGKTPLLTVGARPLDSYNVAFAVHDADYDGSVSVLLDALRALADATKPVSLVMARTSRGLFHVTGLTITERAHTARGNPKHADVSMTLRRASDVSVRVGIVVSSGGSGFGKKG